MGDLNRKSADNVWRALTGKLETEGRCYLYLYESPEDGYNNLASLQIHRNAKHQQAMAIP